MVQVPSIEKIRLIDHQQSKNQNFIDRIKIKDFITILREHCGNTYSFS